MTDTVVAIDRNVLSESSAEHVVGNRYTLVEKIGVGGMGIVWRGFDRLLQRAVAVKEVLIHDGLPRRERDLLCERTLREARAAARLDHPSVIRVYDVAQEDGRPWIIMELLEAQSLADIIAEKGTLLPLRCAEVTLAVLSALQAAHRVGILHRDVKPGNVLLCPNGRVVLTDFGVARSPDESRLTSTGLLLGSPQYIAPERARGCPFGPASDLFSLGATAFAALEGAPPFDRGDAIRTMTAVVCDPPAPMPHAGPMKDIIMGLLAKEPHTRWDAEQTKSALRAVVAAERRRTLEGSAPQPPPATSVRLSQQNNAGETKNKTDSRSGRGKHRRAGSRAILGALTRPIMTAAEATAAIVSWRGNIPSIRGRHSIPTQRPVPADTTETRGFPPHSLWWWVIVGAVGVMCGLLVALMVLVISQ